MPFAQKGDVVGAAPLVSLPRLEELPEAEDRGFDREAVEAAFRLFRRHVASLLAQLREVQSRAGAGGAIVGPSVPSAGRARAEAIGLVRAAADFAETLERDAQAEAVRRLALADEEIRARDVSLADREAEVERLRAELEGRRQELLAEARREAKAEAAGIVEEACQRATDIEREARAEVERQLEWARAQSETVLERARSGARELAAANGTRGG